MTPLGPHTWQEAFQRLDAYLDRELSPDEMRLVREHIEVCAVCAAEFEFEASVLDGVRRKLRQVDLPPDLIARVLATLPSADEDPPPGPP